MAWIILSGIDKSGKSTVAKYYESIGYQCFHMSAPDKKYYEPGYCGPSYLDEMVDVMIKYDGINTVFDRSWYDEIIWPEVYGRIPQLNEEDFEVIHEYEYRNETVKYLLHDHNVKAHWERVQQDSGLKPTSKEQFMKAGRSHMKLLSMANFVLKTINDFPKLNKQPIEEDKALSTNKQEAKDDINIVANKSVTTILDGQTKLEKANAINAILSGSIVKKKGIIYDELEQDIRSFLNNKLNTLLGEPPEDFSNHEVKILKQFCQQMQAKLKQ
jgi:dephospho-CoA kinase